MGQTVVVMVVGRVGPRDLHISLYKHEKQKQSDS